MPFYKPLLVSLRSLSRRAVAGALCSLVLWQATHDGHAQVAGDSVIHDPSRIIRADDRYYVYGTGLGGADGIFFKYSEDLSTWHDPGGNAESNAILSNTPPWVAQEVPNNNGNFWAPSIIQFEDEYRLYYSVSSFGSQESAIGLATNETLDFNSPNYQWVDQGPVIDSQPGSAFNAIDPSVFVDNDDRMWMTFGSFWNGIFITELDPVDGKLLSTNPTLTNIARNPFSPSNSIEAPYIHYRDGYYYLFVNYGSCCQGVDSTYEIRVGRSTNPTGPFVPQEGGRSMVSGAGTLFLDSKENKIGPGHMGIFSEAGVDYFGFHFYDSNSNGLPRYEIEPLDWAADGWPIVLSNLLTGDLNADSTVDIADWIVFLENNSVDLSGLSLVEQRLRGDLDGDGDNDYADFQIFRDAYHAFQGPGALPLSWTPAVPEPSVLALAAACLCCFAVVSRQ